jgi:hypothetical protein
MKNNIELELQKLKNKYPKFFEKTSPKLLEFIFSEETSSKIGKICLENGIEDEEKIEKIAYRVTIVLLGQVPKENLTKIFENGVGLDHETAKKISIGIKMSIFSQVEEVKPKKIQEKTQIEKDQLSQSTKPPLSPIKKDFKKSSKKDTYREPTE